VDAIVGAIVGIVMIVLGLTIDKFYYATSLFGDHAGKRAPTWQGRTMFLFVGIAFLLVALKLLLWPN
jgi:hypothetical protein